MSLVKCNECGQMVSDKAENCPNCGNPISQSGDNPNMGEECDQTPYTSDLLEEPNHKWLVVTAILLILALLGGCAYYYFTKVVKDQTVIITEQFANKIRKYEKLGSFHEGLALAQRNNLWGYIDTKGNEVIPCIYRGTEAGNYGHDFCEGLAAVRSEKGSYGYINKEGEMVIKPQWDDVGDFSEGIASVYVSGKLNFIDKHGKYIAELSNKYIWDYNLDRTLPQFKNGVCEVHIPTKEHSEGVIADIIYIDKKGNQVEKPNDEVKKELYVRYYEGDKVGYKDSIGNIIVPAKYTSLGDFSCGVAVATLEYGHRGQGMEEWYSDDYVGIYGYVDLKGHETFRQQDYSKIKQAEINANIHHKEKKMEREKQAFEQEQREDAESWIQGNWKAGTPYGEIRVGIADDCIAVFVDRQPRYTGPYTIEENKIVYDRRNGYGSYILIDYNNKRLMIDENTPMQRFASSSDRKLSENRDITFQISTDVMAYLIERTFYGNNTRVKIDWDGMFINGKRVASGAPHVVRFYADRALIRIYLIPNSEMYITVFPREGRIVDSGGNSFYVE